MARKQLLWRDAAGLARPTHARAEHEDGPTGGNRRYQSRDEFRGIAAVAIEENENTGIPAHGGDTGLDGATIAAPQFDDHSRACFRCALDGTIPRAAIDNDDLADISCQHRGHDFADRGLLVETGNDR